MISLAGTISNRRYVDIARNPEARENLPEHKVVLLLDGDCEETLEGVASWLLSHSSLRRETRSERESVQGRTLHAKAEQVTAGLYHLGGENDRACETPFADAHREGVTIKQGLRYLFLLYPSCGSSGASIGPDAVSAAAQRGLDRWQSVLAEPSHDFGEEAAQVGRVLLCLLMFDRLAPGCRSLRLAYLPGSAETADAIRTGHELKLRERFFSQWVRDRLADEIWWRWSDLGRAGDVLVWNRLAGEIALMKLAPLAQKIDQADRMFARAINGDREGLSASLDDLRSLINGLLGEDPAKVWQTFCQEKFFRPALQGKLPDFRLFTANAFGAIEGQESKRLDLCHLLARGIVEATAQQGNVLDAERTELKALEDACALQLRYLDDIRRAAAEAEQSTPVHAPADTVDSERCRWCPVKLWDWLSSLFSSEDTRMDLGDPGLLALRVRFQTVAAKLQEILSKLIPERCLAQAREICISVGSIGIMDRIGDAPWEARLEPQGREAAVFPLMAELYDFDERVRREAEKMTLRRERAWAEVASALGYTVSPAGRAAPLALPAISVSDDEIQQLWWSEGVQGGKLWTGACAEWFRAVQPGASAAPQDERRELSFRRHTNSFQEVFETFKAAFLERYGSPYAAAVNAEVEALRWGTGPSPSEAVRQQRILYQRDIRWSSSPSRMVVAHLEDRPDASAQRWESALFILASIGSEFDDFLHDNFNQPKDLCRPKTTDEMYFIEDHRVDHTAALFPSAPAEAEKSVESPCHADP